MIRSANRMRLKPGGYAEYRRHHDEIWPELVAEMERQGIRQVTIFYLEPDLFLYAESTDEGAWIRMLATDVQHRWTRLMVNFLEQNPDGSALVLPLEEIFHLITEDTTPSEP